MRLILLFQSSGSSRTHNARCPHEDNCIMRPDPPPCAARLTRSDLRYTHLSGMGLNYLLSFHRDLSFHFNSVKLKKKTLSPWRYLVHEIQGHRGHYTWGLWWQHGPTHEGLKRGHNEIKQIKSHRHTTVIWGFMLIPWINTQEQAEECDQLVQFRFRRAVGGRPFNLILLI